MSAAARAKKEKPAPGPDDLVRESAGAYKTGDGRFEVQKSDVGWYLVDTEQANEFGQQLIHGPMPTLEAVRDAIPGARNLKPLLRVRPTKGKPKSAATTAPQPKPPPPQSWIDKLPEREAAEARRLIRLLENEGVTDAEVLVRHNRDKPELVATRMIEQRLRAVIDQQPEEDRERAQHLVSRVIEILVSEGTTIPAPGPRWALVEASATADGQPVQRRIRPHV